MSLYAISDLHLAFGIDKPMDIFGARWVNYMEKLEKEWNEAVKDSDVVIIPGDISWATYLEQAAADFNFINRLPGKKIISKGNHDYWWTTISKLNKFVEENSFTTISFMHNNSYRFDNIVLCGTRGWKCPGDDNFDQEDRKIYERELRRLELSLDSLAGKGDEEIIVALHYSPFNSKREISGFIEIMKRYSVKLCLYGHLHGESCRNAVEGNIEGIDFKLISADHLNFRPILLAQ